MEYGGKKPTDANPTERGVLASLGIKFVENTIFTNTTKHGTSTTLFMANIPRFGLIVI